MAHTFIADIQPGSIINDIFMVTQPVLRNTSKGDLYIAMYLSDKTGKVNGRMWQATQEIYQSLPREGFIHISGKSELYQGSLQLVVNNLQVVGPDKINLSDYMPRTEHDIGKMFNELKEIVSTIKNPGLKALTESFLADNDLMKKFCTAPAAVQMHHCYLGGLLEHTVSMLRVAKTILPNYPKVQDDIVIAAIFLHDIAKTSELSYDIGFSYTDTGQLVGHLVMGSIIVKEKAAQLSTPLEKSVLDSLLHIIVSHHGQYEFGSPKLPATAEAFMVNYIDDLDAKMNQITNLIDNDPGDTNWTAYQRSLETRLFRPRPTGEQE
jgi:3'-5' exoribonuclease